MAQGRVPTDGEVSNFIQTVLGVNPRAPIAVSTTSMRDGVSTRGETHFGCRICIAQKGLRNGEIYKLPTTQEEFDKHMAECHPVGN